MKLGALRHPKTLDLVSRLGVKLPTVLGHLELLWAYVAEYSPQGNIGKLSDGAIAVGCQWDGDATTFVTALATAGFLDRDPTHRLLVHDWGDHAPRWVISKLSRAGLRVLCSAKTDCSGGYSAVSTDDCSADCSADCSEHSVSQAKPSHAKPRQEKPSQSEGARAPDGSPAAHPTDPAPAPAEIVFEHWRSTHDHPQARFGDKRRKAIERALKLYPADVLCEAIAGYRNSPFHMGQNENGTVYDDIELLLRDEKQIERGLNLARNPPAKLSSLTRRNIAATEDWMPPELRAGP